MHDDPPASSDAQTFLDALVQRTHAGFETSRTVLAFGEFLDLVDAHPHRFARNAAQYLLDALAWYDVQEVDAPGGRLPRWRAFDAPDDDGEDRVVGHEAAQAELVRILRSFARERRINRLILLHGPNGSAKSSFVAMLFRALEGYSQTDAGAMYRFNWVFPTRRLEAGRIGFGATGGAPTDRRSFAWLRDEEIDARLAAEHNDNPLFLLPPKDRVAFLQQALARIDEPQGPGAGFALSDALRRGDLGQRSRSVFDALLAGYHGDLAQVYRHVQVERFFIARRYRRGAVTVEPQLRVDAGVRQLTADRSLASLPSQLQSQTLFESYGPLPEGNRGLIEFNDLLKRQPELNKYLLATSEKGTVALDTGEMRLDAVLVATANEDHLDEFKRDPDWMSFKGRIELVRMPYLLDWRQEQQVYDDLYGRLTLAQAPAPHTTFLVALFAVLTRLRRADPDSYPAGVRAMVQNLSPVDKAMLYAGGVVPGGLTAEQAQALRAIVPDLMREGAEAPDYEGRFGASAREMKALLLGIAQDPSAPPSPQRVLDALERLVRDRSVYQWLQLKPQGDYRQPDRFIGDARRAYLQRVEREMQAATGLVDESEHERVFDRYILHAKHWLGGEKVVDPGIGRPAPVDVRFLEEVEQRLGRAEDPRIWRSHLISRVAAFRIDNPASEMDMRLIFPQHIERLRDHYFASRREAVDRQLRWVLQWIDGERDQLDAATIVGVEQTLATLATQHGYTPATAREAIGLLLADRGRAAGPSRA